LSNAHPNMMGTNGRFKWTNIIVLVVLLITIFTGAYLRLVGVNWDENQHMHPDERFLSMVQAAISPTENISAYFDTRTSSLNPANRGYSFFVYGTLPIFIVRYVGEALGQTDYNAITIVGRQTSAFFDVITILLVFAIGMRLYNKWVGLLGAVFYALAVLPIQLSHYATVDTITNTFAFLAIYAAVWALQRRPTSDPTRDNKQSDEFIDSEKKIEETSPSFDLSKAGVLIREIAPYLLFGIALGAATASKINAIVVALLLPMVEGIRYYRMTPQERRVALLAIFRNIIIAAILSFLVFRIGQPYAFDGPGFFNLGINENWWSSMQSLRAQASGDVDFPPALQWARRPITFSWENLVKWGLGSPLGLLAWASYVAMGWMILRKKDWHLHLPLWTYTGLYFTWQSVSWVRSMRYQMLIYPALALVAGWGLVRLWSVRKAIKLGFLKFAPKFVRITGIVVTVIVILSTAIWAFAFSRIYTQPHPRVAASRWIYQNIPGALTLEMETEEGYYQRPLSYQAGDTFGMGDFYRMPFYPPEDGSLSAVTFPYIVDPAQRAMLQQVRLIVFSGDQPNTVLGSAWIESQFLPLDNERRGASYTFVLEDLISVLRGKLYYLQLDLLQHESTLLLNGSPTVSLLTSSGMPLETPLPRIQQSIRADRPYSMSLYLVETGVINAVHVPFLVDQAGFEGSKDLTLSIINQNRAGISRSVSLRSEFKPEGDCRGAAYVFELDEPLRVEATQTLTITLTTSAQGAQLVLYAPAPVHESSWDDAVPYGVLGFSPYSEDGGIYRSDLNFEMYWADDENKLIRFETNLDLADYIFITSSRQWGTTTRVPERYLLTTFYYRNLLGCPTDKEVEWCYNVAEPGMFEGALGFKLVATFQSNPKLGPLEFNTQFAEEAFTVYDHPKVFIFEKTDAYDPITVREMLRSVDLSKVVYFTPGDAAKYQGPDPSQLYEPKYNLMLPDDRLAEQREWGSWSALFNTESLVNTSQPLAAAVFYGFVTLLGLLCFPIIRLGFPGLHDRGYPLSKLAGLLLLAFIVWILGSFGISFTSTMITLVLVGIGLFSLVLILLQRKQLWSDLRENWRYYLAVEFLALIAFVFFIMIRMGNPDLWHPWKGGEKPMDFSYLNAVLKSKTFPPYDPWFTGGYINYYYYGFVIVGVPIKLLGIVPAVAYNIVLPIWYSLLVLGAFSVGWNLYQGIPRSHALRIGEKKSKNILGMALLVGLVTAIGLALLGNLGTVRLIVNGYQRIASGGIAVEDAALPQKISWAIQGFVQFLRGTPMPFYPGDWYWYPSRVIPGEPITEFPYFSFIYGDLHAHLIAFPITILAISWSLSVVLSKAKWGEKDDQYKWLGGVIGFLLGALVIGALRPTNTWDFYTYIVLASIALMYSILRHYIPRWKLNIRWGDWMEKIGVGMGAVLLLVLLALLFYHPFSYWYGQGYTSVEMWEGARTPLDSYFTHWGLFLFLVISWMGWETFHWMKTTPQTDLQKLEPYRSWLYAILIMIVVLLFIFLVMGVVVALVALPLGLWAVVLMLRPGRSDGMRFLLFLIGTAVTLTLVVELIYLPGDIGRMNTVFKFYLQVWIIFALSAGVCLGWVIQSLRYWKPRLIFVWQVVLFMLVTSAALFTLMGTTDKIRDRMTPDAPHTLDGIAFMQDATFYDMGVNMQLGEDYEAIRWVQENIKGSPVILEGQAFEYRWGNRFTIYTGLPGVIGWNWHQRQQRAILRNNIVQERVDAVNLFYTTEDLAYVNGFLDEHDVAYIIVGQLEYAFYPGVGLTKFDLYEGVLWEAVYQDGMTTIYRVLD
jgi:YYY domain-containing protein